MRRKPIKNRIAIYIVDDKNVKDPLCREVNYNLLEGSVRHDIEYKYFKDYDTAFKILSYEKTPYVLFTKPSGTFDPYHLSELVNKDLSDYALIGHLLDKDSQYYELHEQSFIINTNAYRDVGCPTYNGGDNYELQNIARSNENYHDGYTPLFVTKGSGKSTYKNVKPGSLIISKLLENNYKIRPWADEERRHKFYLYNDLTLKYGSYLRIETNFSDSIFNCATEPLVTEDLPTVQRIVSPANGLQALAIVDKCPNLHTIEFKDINIKQLEFTKKLIDSYQGKDFADFCYSTNLDLHNGDRDSMTRYEENFLANISTDWATLKERLSNINISFSRESFFEIEQFVNHIKENCVTLYNYSNILSYRKTYYLYSQIHFNLMIKVLAHEERLKGNNSFIRGILPSSETIPGFGTQTVQEISLDPDPILNFEWREELYEYYTDYLKILRKKEIRKTLSESAGNTQ